MSLLLMTKEGCQKARPRRLYAATFTGVLLTLMLWYVGGWRS